MNVEDGLVAGPLHLLDKATLGLDHEFGVPDVVVLGHLLGEAGQDLYQDPIHLGIPATEILDLLLEEDQDRHTDERDRIIRGKGQVPQLDGGDLGHHRGDPGHLKEEQDPDLMIGIRAHKSAGGLDAAVHHHHQVERGLACQGESAPGPRRQIN